MNKWDEPFTPGELEQLMAGMPPKHERQQPRAMQPNAEAAVRTHIGRALEDIAFLRAALEKIEKGVNVKIAKLEEEIGQLRSELQLQRTAEKADVITLPPLPLMRRSDAA